MNSTVSEYSRALVVAAVTCSWLVMDYDRISHGSHGGGIEVKRAVVVFPGRNGRCNVGLARRFRVSSVWGSRQSHRKLGKASDTTARMERKCDLNVRNARSAMLRR